MWKKITESITSAEQVEAIVRRVNSELGDADIDKKFQEILLFDLEEKRKSFNLETEETKKDIIFFFFTWQLNECSTIMIMEAIWIVNV